MSDWRTVHAAVFGENDKAVLEKLVHASEGAIYARMQELAQQREHSPEMQQLKIAIQELLLIKTTKLGWPDPLRLEYDIFSGDPKNSPVWIAKVQGIGAAYERMKQLAASKPGRYFLFDPRCSQSIAQLDTIIPGSQ